MNKMHTHKQRKMESNNSIRADLASLVSKYGNAANIVKELKKLQGGDSTKRAKLEAALDKVIADYGTITLARFKKEAAKAWHRAFPEGVEKREVKGYQLFVKETMPKVKEEHPDKTHTERMAMIGKMWQDSKGVPPAPADEMVEDTSADPPGVGNKRHREPTPPPQEVPKRTRRGKAA